MAHTSNQMHIEVLKTLVALLDAAHRAALLVQRQHQLRDRELGVEIRVGVVDDVVFGLLPVQHARKRARIAHVQAHALAAARLQLPGAHLLDHAAAVDEAVVRGEAGKLVEDVAGDEHGDALLAVKFR